MTLNEMIAELKTIANQYGDLQVILQRDPEGNGYAPLCGVDADCIFDPSNEDFGRGAVYSVNMSAEDNGFEEEEEWQEWLKKPRCVVLWPSY